MSRLNQKHFDPTVLKAQLRLASQRCRTLSQKRSSLNTLARKEVAKLLASGKEESARVKVEFVIMEDNFIEAMEMVDLYCQTLLARYGLLQAHKYLEDEAIKEPVFALIWASQYMPPEVKELQPIRAMLVDKYPKDLTEVINDLQNYVNPKLVKKLNPDMKAPSKRLVDAYLAEIAASHNVAWSPPADEVLPPEPLPPSPPMTAEQEAALLAEDDAGGIDESPLGFHQYLKQQAAEYQAQVQAPSRTGGDEGDDLALPAVPTTPPGGDGDDDDDDDFGDLAARFNKLKG